MWIFVLLSFRALLLLFLAVMLLLLRILLPLLLVAIDGCCLPGCWVVGPFFVWCMFSVLGYSMPMSINLLPSNIKKIIANTRTKSYGKNLQQQHWRLQRQSRWTPWQWRRYSSYKAYLQGEQGWRLKTTACNKLLQLDEKQKQHRQRQDYHVTKIKSNFYFICMLEIMYGKKGVSIFSLSQVKKFNEIARSRYNNEHMPPGMLECIYVQYFSSHEHNVS